MFRTSIFFFTLISTIAFAHGQNEIMYRFNDPETGDDCGYLNKWGDTLIPVGECMACFSDKLQYAIVFKNNDKSEGFPAINSRGKIIFTVLAFDNGPDYIENGTMRIIEDGKIGYANEAGKIIIKPQFGGAWPFAEGRAQVSIHATKESDGEHWFWTDTDWFYIDKNGNRIED